MGRGSTASGDVHGRNDLLDQMAERVKADMEGQSFEKVVTVFLGDYVDRGFGSMRRARTTVTQRMANRDNCSGRQSRGPFVEHSLKTIGFWKLGAAWVASKPCTPTE